MAQYEINSLIRKISLGDKEAFESLYLEMKKNVYYYALQLSGSRDIAEDVLQETFIAVWSKSGSFVKQGSGRAWVLQITKNKTLDAIKKIKTTLPLDDYEKQVGNTPPFACNFEDNMVLNDMFKSLTSKERNIVILRVTVGFTLTEIAKEMNLKKGSVFWTYSNAVKKLRKEYERMESYEQSIAKIH